MRTLTIRPALLYAYLGLMLLVIPAVLWVSLDLWRRTGTVPWSTFLGLAVIACGAYVLLPPMRWRVTKFIRKQPEIVIPHTVDISPEWLSAKTSMSESKHSWQTLYSLEEDVEYLYLFVTKVSARVVPKRASSSLTEAQAFLGKARRYRDAALTGQPLPDDAPAADTGVWPPPPQSVKQNQGF